MKNLNAFKKSLLWSTLMLTIFITAPALPKSAHLQTRTSSYSTLMHTLNTRIAPLMARVKTTSLSLVKRRKFWIASGIVAAIAAITVFDILAWHYPISEKNSEKREPTYTADGTSNPEQFTQKIELITIPTSFKHSTKQSKYGQPKVCFANTSFSKPIPQRWEMVYCGKNQNETIESTLRNLDSLLQIIDSTPELSANIKEITIHSHGLPYIKSGWRTCFHQTHFGFWGIENAAPSKSSFKSLFSAIKIKCSDAAQCKDLLADINKNLPLK